MKSLTIKQIIFVQKLLEGTSGTQAALYAYNTKDPNVAKVIASENLTKPNIQQALKTALHSKGLTLDVAIENISNLANASPIKGVSADVKLKANLELLMLSGAYSEMRASLSSTISSEVRSLSFHDAKTKFLNMNNEAKEFISDLKAL